MKKFLIVILTIISINVSAQNDNLPFKELGAYSEEFSPNNIVARMIEGLGYRFYWATESLTDKDLKYKPCLLYTSPSPRDRQKSRMPSSA